MSSRTAQIVEPLRCPKCSNVLIVEQLVAEDESCLETVLFINCPKGDFTIAATDKELVAVVTDIVMEHLNRRTSLGPPSAG